MLILHELSYFEKTILHYHFRDKSLLATALNVTAIGDSQLLNKNYEQLEFLGDAVFEVIVIGNAFYEFE